MLSEMYLKYENLLVLHVLSPVGELDRNKRTLKDRIEYCKGKEISCFAMLHKIPFDNFGTTGIIITNGEVVRVCPTDCGSIKDFVVQMSDDDIKSTFESIVNKWNENKYPEIYIKNPEFHDLFYISDPEGGIPPYPNCEVVPFLKENRSYSILRISRKDGSISYIEPSSGCFKEISSLSEIPFMRNKKE